MSICKQHSVLVNPIVTHEKPRPYQTLLIPNNIHSVLSSVNYPYNSIFSVKSNPSGSESSHELLLPNVSRMATSWPHVNDQLLNPNFSFLKSQAAKLGRWQISKSFILFNKFSNYDFRFEKMFSFSTLNDGKSFERSEVFKTFEAPLIKESKSIETSKRIRKKGAGRKTANPKMEADLIQWFNEYVKEKC